ncbi:protein of unknown function (DUF1992) [Desulfosporosinus acidiphilus SJ4]|uniref:DnaJ homologue subfamily C member 28 conserved domain-containing protein n=1 Tax=Desulfosporosinus acidiphilus (strain DSM 22704 / JCM 16185 / SJ4) TaxID=646529 RepID=I4D0Z6_DESAJ|nr:DUF1992 domain-containing protein [Desulfosporosinus acidiphilus]AFM39470.1 protein of unknown function (DUF1992) [Desulfosporosinus acidiphilus SJ4]
MSSIFDKIAEDRIQEAFRNGEFDNLPSQGKPISLDYWASLPVEIRAGLMVLKNAGFVPEEVQLLKDIEELRERLVCCESQEEKLAIHREIEEKRLKYNLITEYKKRKK